MRQMPERDACGAQRPPWSRDLHLSAGAALVGIIAVAAVLRLSLLGQNSLWFDEAWVVWIVQHRWQDIVPLLAEHDAHPPLYYLLMKAWIGIAGAHEAVLRLPSAGCSVLSVALTYALMRRISPAPVGLLSAFVVGVSPFAVMSGQDARMYALLGTLALASTLSLVAGVERGGVVRWGGYVLLTAAMIYTHYFGGLVTLAHGIWVAWYERRHLGIWLLAMGAVASLYVPWVPSLWQQIATGNGWPWYRRGAVFLGLGDLLGLMAFGGSLFGMGSYFFSERGGSATKDLILLPFLLTVGWGAVSWSDRRSLALIGLPLAVTGVVTTSLSLAGHLIFYPRWFSFLLPFYAMLLARGLEGIAGRWPGRRTEVLALITAGLLAFGVPVLGRYYLDPSFRPYPWRAAAGVVRQQFRPGDFLLFVNGSGEIAFSYYFHEPHPSLALTPVEAAHGADRDPAFTDVQVRALARRYPRVWIIATAPFTPSMQQRLFSALGAAFHAVGYRQFNGVGVYLFEAESPPLH